MDFSDSIWWLGKFFSLDLCTSTWMGEIQINPESCIRCELPPMSTCSCNCRCNCHGYTSKKPETYTSLMRLMLTRQDLKKVTVLLNIFILEEPIQVKSLNLFHLWVPIFNRVNHYRPQYSQIPQPQEKVLLEDTFCEITASTAQAPKF